MSAWHITLAVLVAFVWGVAFVVGKVGLEIFTASELTALRFVVASAAALFVPLPAASWKYIVGVGLTTFTAQFLFLFFGIAFGMPAGLAAIVVHTQMLFTVLFAAILLHEVPKAKQTLGLSLAAIGLCIIALSIGGDISSFGFVLCIFSAISWAVGNVLVKQLPNVNMLQLMVWASLVPPLPALLFSTVFDGSLDFWHKFSEAPLIAFGVPLYLGIIATVWAFSVWGHLLQRYSAGTIAPFALVAPCVGIGMSAWLLGEEFGALRLTGILAILLGLAIAIFPSSIVRGSALLGGKTSPRSSD